MTSSQPSSTLVVNRNSLESCKFAGSVEPNSGQAPPIFGRVHPLALVQYLLDLMILALAFAGAYAIRFDGTHTEAYFGQFLMFCPWVVAIEFALIRRLKPIRNSWRFVGLRESRAVFEASLAMAGLLLAFRLAAPLITPGPSFTVPFGIVAGNMFLMPLGVLGIRVLRRLSFESQVARKLGHSSDAIAPTLVIGAGSAGRLLANEVAKHSIAGVNIVGFVDDDRTLRGRFINEIEIYGSLDELRSIVARTGATQALIAIASVRGVQIRRIKDVCDECDLKVTIVPPINDLVSGQINFSQIREVQIEDLLGRPSVDMSDFKSTGALMGKVVMVTGAGGSIGSEISRQVLKAGPATLIMVEQAENSMYHIDRELQPVCGATLVVPAIADVVDEARMRDLFLEFEPDAVFHAAAHKHVPMMEANPREAIKNNAIGTRTVADLASEFDVDSFVLISTDKAVNPTSVMGATKRLAEMYLQALQRNSRTRFISVRFGNVLGSTGSVIPLFKDQIAKGGPVTVTDPEMVRYFMTIPEACQLVLEAGAIGQHGDLLTLDMGEPIKIADLAEQMIRLSGFEPGSDIEIKFVGMRPGEKLYEELSFDHEMMLTTRCSKIFLHKPGGAAKVSTQTILQGIQYILLDPDNVRGRIGEIVTSFQPEHGPSQTALNSRKARIVQ